MVYDNIISIGLKCDVSFNLRRIYGFVDSFPFSWADCCIYKIADALENIDSILTGRIKEFREWNMFLDIAFNIAFHGQRNPKELKNDSDYAEQLAELKSRMLHLIVKQKKLWQSNTRQLYVMSLPTYKVSGVSPDELNKYLGKIVKVLNNKTTKADLMVIADLQTSKIITVGGYL